MSDKKEDKTLTEAKRFTCGLASLICDAIGIVGLTLPMAISAIVLSVIANKSEDKTTKALAGIGSGIAIALVAFMVLALMYGLSMFNGAMQNLTNITK